MKKVAKNLQPYLIYHSPQTGGKDSPHKTVITEMARVSQESTANYLNISISKWDVWRNHLRIVYWGEERKMEDQPLDPLMVHTGPRFLCVLCH